MFSMPPNGMNPLHFSGAPQKGTSRPSRTQITIESHSKNRTDQSHRGQLSFPAHGKVPEGPLPSASLPLLTTCTTTLLAFPSAACFRTPSRLYPNPVPFPATPLPPRYVQLVARTTAMFSHRFTPRPTDPLNLSARFPVNKEDTTGIAHHSMLDHSRALYSALLRELASRFSASRAFHSGRTQRAPPIDAYPFRAWLGIVHSPHLRDFSEPPSWRHTAITIRDRRRWQPA
jgi:hypothetical protein